MSQEAIIIVLLAIVAIALFMKVVKDNYYNIPFLSYSQGNDSFEGTVRSINKIGPDVFQIAVAQGMENKTDPNLEKGNLISFSVETTRFIHLRGTKNLPTVGMMISAKTTNINYRLNKRSLNWVKDWWVVASIRSAGSYELKKGETGT